MTAIQRILGVLDEPTLETPRLPELAGMAHMSRSQFSAIFHAVAGLPFRDYVVTLRLRSAQKLLRTTRTSLTAIAMECGFCDLPHLDKAFRKRFGVSPSQFRTGG